ncbi:MAG: universal stress protein [Firmicutes bacterium]|nr:universal stress protein [Bacillota bacterium]
MSKYKNILVAFDGSDSSKNALKQILGMAKVEGFRATAVTVIHANDSEAEASRIRNAKEASVTPGKAVYTNSVKLVIEENGDSVQTILEEGIVHKAIIDVAENRSCDLIVMGRRKLPRIERALIGSVTAQVLRHSPIDVLVMQRSSSLGWRKILLATDGSHYSQVAAQRALEIAQEHGGELNVVSVIDTTDAFYTEMPGNLGKMGDRAHLNIEHVRQLAESMDVKINAFIREGDPHKEIIRIADELKVDVICMGTHGRTGLTRIIMGSVAEQALANAPCSVLVVKA